MQTRRALRLVRAMRENGVAPNSKVFAQLVTLFARSGNLDRTMSTLSAALSAGCVLPPETYESVARCILLRLNERGNAAADNLSTARSRMASLRDIMSKNGVPAFRREFMEYMERQRGGSSRW
ncbi:hypothetical protein EON67_05240 [archaeon]|nr:MAG: hypothetical protein EON67_05240 [archaeon]